MSYFKRRIAEGMRDPEYRQGRAEAILELIHFTIQPSDSILPFSSTGVDVHIHAPEVGIGTQSVVPPTIGIGVGLKEAVAGQVILRKTPEQPPKERIGLSLMLADAAQVHMGKLYVMGGAINLKPPNVAGLLAIAGTVSVPWGETNHEHELSIRLVSDGDRPVLVPTPMGEQPFIIKAQFELGRPPGIPRGMPLLMPFAVQFALPGLSEGLYQFLISIDEIPVHESALPLCVLSPQ